MGQQVDRFPYNKINNFQSKQKYIDVFVEDTSGIVPYIENYQACLYMKKYPLRSDQPLDLSTNEWTRDNSLGKIRFNISPFINDLSVGDYLYEVVLDNGRGQRFTAVQDRYTLIKSLKNDVGDFEIFSVDPSAYMFHINDLSTNFTVSTGTSWKVDAPSWLTATPDMGTGGGAFKLETSPTYTRSDQVRVWSPYSARNILIDVSYWNVLLGVNPTTYILTNDNSTKQINVSTETVNRWNVTSWPSWIDVTDSSGTGNGSFTITSDSSIFHDYEDITVDSSYALSDTTSIQYYPELIVDSSNQSFQIDDKNNNLSIESPPINTISFINVPEWLTIEPSTGTGDFDVSLYADPSIYDVINTSFEIQTDYFNNYTINVNFIDDPSSSITPLEHEFYRTDGSIVASISSYDEVDSLWYLSNKPSWVNNVEPSSGIGNFNIDIDISALNNVDGSIIFSNDRYTYDLIIDVSFYNIKLDALMLWEFEDTLQSYNGNLYPLERVDYSGLTGMSFIDGKVGKAVEMNPTTFLKNTNSIHNSVFKKDWSVSMWFKVKASIYNDRSWMTFGIGDSFVPSNMDVEFFFTDFGNEIRGDVLGTDIRVDTSTYESYDWNHVVYTYDWDSSILKMYLNNEIHYDGSVNMYTPSTYNGFFIHNNVSSSEDDIVAYDQTYVFEKTLENSDISILFNNGNGI